jgi:hypothetical protein
MCFIHALIYYACLQAMEKFVEGNAIQTLDPNLEATDAINLAVEKLYELALQCLAPTKRNRPSMKRCAEILWSIRKDYRELVVPTSAMNWSRSSGAVKWTKRCIIPVCLSWFASKIGGWNHPIAGILSVTASGREQDWWPS